MFSNTSVDWSICSSRFSSSVSEMRYSRRYFCIRMFGLTTISSPSNRRVQNSCFVRPEVFAIILMVSLSCGDTRKLTVMFRHRCFLSRFFSDILLTCHFVNIVSDFTSPFFIRMTVVHCHGSPLLTNSWSNSDGRHTNFHQHRNM